MTSRHFDIHVGSHWSSPPPQWPDVDAVLATAATGSSARTPVVGDHGHAVNGCPWRRLMVSRGGVLGPHGKDSLTSGACAVASTTHRPSWLPRRSLPSAIPGRVIFLVVERHRAPGPGRAMVVGPRAAGRNGLLRTRTDGAHAGGPDRPRPSQFCRRYVARRTMTPAAICGLVAVPARSPQAGWYRAPIVVGWWGPSTCRRTRAETPGRGRPTSTGWYRRCCM